MNNENIKNVDKFVCEPCGFVTSFKRDYSRHLQTKKHMKMKDINLETDRMYACLCGKRYTSRNSLWYHKKTCQVKECEEVPKEETSTDLVVSTAEPSAPEMNNVIEMMETTIAKQNEILEKLHDKHVELATTMVKPKRSRAGRPRNARKKLKQSITDCEPPVN